MSNLKNIDASTGDREAALEKLFAKMPSELSVNVDLPSRGKFYSNYTGATVSPLTFEDEQRILVSRNKQIDPISELISKCVRGVNTPELIPQDKLWLLFKIREVSYGSDYEFPIICPACTKNVDSNIDISTLPINGFPDDFEDVREIKLPILKVTAKVRLPRQSDEVFLDPEATVSNLKRFTVELDGSNDPVFISAALDRMHIRDHKKIRSNIFLDQYGAETKFQFECPYCKHGSVMAIPFSINFFLAN